MSEQIPVGNLNTPKEEAPYKYANICQTSPVLLIQRQVKEPELIQAVIKELQKLINEPQAAWNYNCSPPEKIMENRENAPAYVPLEPATWLSISIADWIRFNGLRQTILDSFTLAKRRSRAIDKDCRSANFEKFDDETFQKTIALGVDKISISDLNEQKTWITTCVCRGYDPDKTTKDEKGNPVFREENKLGPTTNFQKFFEKIKELEDRIQAKRRNTEEE